MAKTDEEKLHIVHSVIGWTVALFVVMLLIISSILSPAKSEEDYREELKERYKDKYEACTKSMVAQNILVKQKNW